MNSRDKEAVAHFRKTHLWNIPKMLKGAGRMNPSLYLFGRRRQGDYGVAVLPVLPEMEVPINVFRAAAKQLFDELLCLSYSSEAFMWKGEAKGMGIDVDTIDEIKKDDPRILDLKKNAKRIDILWISFETAELTESKVYEVRKTGGSMVTAFGDMTDDFQLIEMSDEFDGGHLTGRFTNLFKKIVKP